jgi:hypothetical protein
MRSTSLKRTKRGYVRNLGRLPQGVQPKFYLGHDRDVAGVRLEQIVLLWQMAEERHASKGLPGLPVWDPNYLEMAKAIAKGDVSQVAKGDYEMLEDYFQRVNELARRLNTEIRPASTFLYETGRQDIETRIVEDRTSLATGAKSDHGGRMPTGQALHQALRAYQVQIEREYRDADGTITDNGKTKLTQIKTILNYVPNLDLGDLERFLIECIA